MCNRSDEKQVQDGALPSHMTLKEGQTLREPGEIESKLRSQEGSDFNRNTSENVCYYLVAGM